jgi:F-type H+-transporting ATPase subunit b
MSKVNWLATSMLALALAVPSIAESPPNPGHQVQPASTSASRAAGAANDPKEETGKEANENDAFRHSSAIKLVARITGLNLDTAYWLCVVLNFIFIFAILWLLLRKKVPALYASRTAAIQDRLEEARRASADARRRLTLVEERLSRLDTEIEQMRHQAEAGSQAEEQRVMAAAEEERRRIVESAEQEIARAVSVAKRELRAYVAELAVGLAEKEFHIAQTTDEKLVHHFASRLGEDSH